jgi:hemoglobin/transferrin/lactoferrin receptor protein
MNSGSMYCIDNLIHQHMKRKFLLWLILLFPWFLSGQVALVRNLATGEPVELVTLMSEKPRWVATTNAQGEANIASMRDAKKIEIRMLGYKTMITSYAMLSTDTFKVWLTPVSFNLDVVVVSGTRWNQSSRDIPAKIATISAGEVAMQNPQTAADLLGMSGKVFIQKSQQGGGSPMIRGFATNRLLYTIDGVRMNTAIFRSGNIQNVISLDPYAIEQTEVFFGPGSVIYGSDAIGGVMSFQTLTPKFSQTNKPVVVGKAVTRYSTANQEKSAHFDVNVGWKRWAMVTSITSNDFGDLKMGSHGPEEYLRPFYVQRIDSVDVVVSNDDPEVQRPTGYSQINLMQKVRYQPNRDWDVQYGFHYSETSSYSRYDRHIRYKNGLPRYGEWSYGPQKWMMNNLSIAHNRGNKMYDQLNLRLAHQFFEESRIDRNINKPERHIRAEEVTALSANLDFNKLLAARHTIFYGFEAVINDVVSSGMDENIITGSSLIGPSRYPQALWGSYALYLTDQFKISEKFLIQAGARYNHFMLDATFDTTFYPFPFTSASLNKGALTGSIGFVYRPAEKWVISANGSTGFRAPNVDDLGKVFDSAPGIVVVPNPDLGPEYAWSGDVEVAKVFGDFMKVDLSGYLTSLQNAMVRRDFTLNGMDSILYDGEMSRVQAVQNAAVALVYGIQAGVEVKLPSGFGFSSDFNFQKGVEELDDGSVSPSRHAAPWFGVSKITWRAGTTKLELNLVYSGKKTFEDLPEEERSKTEIYAIDDQGNPWSPGWYTLNFKAMHQITPQFCVSAGLENITDQRYRPYSSGIVAPGRNFVLSLKANL